jgi:hypothetical protein
MLRAEASQVLEVSLSVSNDFRDPVAKTRLRNTPESAAVPMPKAPVDENRLLPRYEGEVRMAWQITSMKTVPESKAVDQSADEHLRLRVLGADQTHLGASGASADVIHG